MAWLSGWRHRCRLTVDRTRIDANLTWFPILVKISVNCGKDGQDMTCIFDEVGDNSLKIAFTTADETTHLYAEIESWDSGSEVAYIWVSRDGWDIFSALDTDFYIYYDNTKPDNNAFIGTIGNRPEVWDAYFTEVLHLADDIKVWTYRAPKTTAVGDPACAVTGGLIYVIGGYTNVGATTVTNENEVYNPAGNSWASKVAMTTARWGCMGATDGSKIYVFGGTIDNLDANMVKELEIYNIAGDGWAAGADLPVALRCGGCVYNPDNGLIYIIGGRKSDGSESNKLYSYDPVGDNYDLTLTDIPQPVQGATCAYKDGKIYVIGGYDTGVALTVTRIYTISTDSWDTGTSAPEAKYGQTGYTGPALWGDYIYYTHGKNGGYHASAYRYEITADSWLQFTTGLKLRDGLASGIVDGKLYTIAGRDATGPLDEVEEYILPIDYQVDSTGNNYHGAAKNMEADDQVIDNIDGCINLDGGNEFIDVAKGMTPISGDDSWTVECWARHDIDEIAILWSRAGAANVYGATVPVGTIRFLVGAALFDSDAAEIVVGNWYSLAFVKTAALTGEIYKNGTMIKAGALQAMPVMDEDLNIGEYNDTQLETYPWNGRVDEFRVSTVIRLASWIKASYYSGDDNLVSWTACPCGELDCPSYDNEIDCENAGCCWYDGTCYDCGEVPCEYWDNQVDCEGAGCYWYNGTCHSTPYEPPPNGNGNGNGNGLPNGNGNGIPPPPEEEEPYGDGLVWIEN